MFRILAAIFAALVLASCGPASGGKSGGLVASITGVGGSYAVGDVVPYRRGENFHIELMAFFKTPQTDVVLAEERANVRYPVSYAYPINQRIRAGQAGYRFAECGLRATVTIYGLSDPRRVGEVDILQTGDVKIGTIRPSEYGPNFVTFRNMDVDQVRTLVIPYMFTKSQQPEHRPVVHIEAKNFVPKGPFAVAQEVMFDLTHRVFPNGGLNRINVGMLMPIEIDPAEPVCSRGQRTAAAG
jgi:hypothetical protein